MLSDDFDVDALLDAQSSDDDGNDLPELERSLDDILNDTDFSDILGDCIAEPISFTISNSNSKIDSPSQNGDAGKGLDGKVDGNFGSGLAREKANGLEVCSAGGQADHQDQDLIVDGLPAVSLQDNGLKLDAVSTSAPIATRNDNVESGPEPDRAIGRKSEALNFISTLKTSRSNSSNGRPYSPSQASYFPTLVGNKPSFKPGAAVAAAAAASRQTIFTQSLTSWRSKNIFNPFKNITSELQEVPMAYPATSEVDADVDASTEAHILKHSEETLTDDIGKRLSPVLPFEDCADKSGASVETPSMICAPEVESFLSKSPSDAFCSTENYQGSITRTMQYSEDVLDSNSPAALLDLVPASIDTVLGELELQPRESSNVSKQFLSMEEDLSEECSRTLLQDEVEELAELDAIVNEESSVENVLAELELQNEKPSDALWQDVQDATNHVQNTVMKPTESANGVQVTRNDTQSSHDAQLLSALEIAEELEKKAASSGLHWEEGAVAQPMRLEGIQRGAPAIGFLQLDSGGALSFALQSAALRRDHGTPQALAVHSNFIAVGLSKGAVLVIPSKYSATRIADETDAKAFILVTSGSDKSHLSVSSMCFNQQGDMLLVGYANGTIMLWDVPRASVAKAVEKEHTSAVVHSLFLGQDMLGSRNLKAITADSKGLTLLHTFTVLPVLRRYSVTTQCLLDGQRTGVVLSVSPLLLDENSSFSGGQTTVQQGAVSVLPMNLNSVKGVVGGVSSGTSDVGRKFLYDGSPTVEEGGGLVVFVTHQAVLVVRLVPALDVCARLSRPDGVQEGSIPYTAWRRTKHKSGLNVAPTAPANGAVSEPQAQKGTDGRILEGSQLKEDTNGEGVLVKANTDVGSGGEHFPLLALAWDKKLLIVRLLKAELKVLAQWNLESSAVGVAWLEEQLLVVATSKDQLFLFTNEGIEIERAILGGEYGSIGAITYHTHFLNNYGNPEKAYHNALAVRGAALYLLGHVRLWRARLLPWRDRIKALQNAGDWMGAFHIAMELYDGRSQGVTGLPRGLDALREAIMPTLLALLSAYIDEAFAYISLALGCSPVLANVKATPAESVVEGDSLAGKSGVFPDGIKNGNITLGQELKVEAREQYARVGGVAIEFCVHIGKTVVLFENVFSKFEAVGQRGTFLELLEPYILKDMLSGLAPEVMQALVEHYSQHGWLHRVEQCVLHMDIASLDFNQVVRVCRDHELYSALIYLFNKGLNDFKSPLEELLAVAQNSSHQSSAKGFGYKLLVYLKYCFSGLSFPPGHGALPPSRLPPLRAEILDYLLEMDSDINSPVEPKHISNKTHPRLLYILELDTQATLMVLGSAFPEYGPLGVGKRDWVYPSRAMTFEPCQTKSQHGKQFGEVAFSIGDGVIEGLHYAQLTVNALIKILEVAMVPASNYAAQEATTVGHLNVLAGHVDDDAVLEFIAHFAAGKYAVVPSATLSQILEHLASEPPCMYSSLEGKEKEVLKNRENLMVALLRAVPSSDWDSVRTMQLAQHRGFWQVTALLYANKGDYTSALDSYLKDESRPQQPFTFITNMLSGEGGLKDFKLLHFRETVLASIPELIQRSTKFTLLVVLEHFSSENQRILKELASNPNLQFKYLKAMMNARTGSFGCSLPEQENEFSHNYHSASGSQIGSESQHDSSQRVDGHSSIAQESTLTDLLQRSGLEFTNEMAELFVELLCQFERKSVLKFLESYENYRLEHCLKLCQEYGITDAAAFLLERVGDVGSALALVLADVDLHFEEMDRAVAKLFSSTEITRNFNSLTEETLWGKPEVTTARSVMGVAVALCQRNTFRLDYQESESLWFRLLDRFVEPLSDLNILARKSVLKKQNGGGVGQAVKGKLQGRRMVRWKVLDVDVATKFVRKVLVQFIGEIVDGMIGFVPLRVIMGKILEDHGTHEFGDFKTTILDMLGAYGYECAILGTAKQLVESDTFHNINALRKGYTHAFVPTNSICCICVRPLHVVDESMLSLTGIATSRHPSSEVKGKELESEQPSSSHIFDNRVCIFFCGHAAHFSCLENSYEGTGAEAKIAHFGAYCPVCSCKQRKVSNGKGPNVLWDNVRDGASLKPKSENDAVGSPHSSRPPMGSFVSSQSRLELLKQLEKGTDLHELGPVMQLNLAPGRLGHKQGGPVVARMGNSSHGRGIIRISLSGNSKGDTLQSSQRKAKARLHSL